MSEQVSNRVIKDNINKIFNAEMLIREEERRTLISKASRLIDAIKKRRSVVHEITENPRINLSSAPKEIPVMTWNDTIIEAAPEDGIEEQRLNLIGSIGEYHVSLFNNERPATLLDTGFYAGVLAVKAGLVDPESFHHDMEEVNQLEENPEKRFED